MRIESFVAPAGLAVATFFGFAAGPANLNRLTELTNSGVTGGVEYETVLQHALIDLGVAAGAAVVAAIAIVRLRSSN